MSYLSVYFLKMYTLLRALHCLHKLLLVRIAESFEVCSYFNQICLHKLLLVRIAESFQVSSYLSIKFAVLRRQRKRKSGETLQWPATGIPRNKMADALSERKVSSDWPILKKIALQVAEGMLHASNLSGNVAKSRGSFNFSRNSQRNNCSCKMGCYT